jgi:hypothetical protein
MSSSPKYRFARARAGRACELALLTGLLGVAGCGDPPPDIAVYATTGSTGLQLSASICKLADPSACGTPTPLLDGTNQTAQGGIYSLTAGEQFPLVFQSPSIQPSVLACRKVVVTFHQAQQVINVSISTAGIDIECDSPANCSPPVPCGP